jgi:hypothetical protein
LPAARPYWKGYLKLSFASRPVALYPATSAAERGSFRQVNRRTRRLKHKLVREAFLPSIQTRVESAAIAASSVAASMIDVTKLGRDFPSSLIIGLARQPICEALNSP